MVKHKSSQSERTTCKKEKRKLCTNGTCHKKNKFCLIKQYGTSHWILQKKEKLLSHRAEWYKSLDPEEKEKLLSKSADWKKKQKRAEWFNLLNSAQKQKRVEWYKSLNPEKKENFCLEEWYKTLDPADKDKITSQVQVNKETHRNSVPHDLDHRIPFFQSKIREGSYYICSVCNRILYRKTVKQTNVQHSARTIY